MLVAEVLDLDAGGDGVDGEDGGTEDGFAVGAAHRLAGTIYEGGNRCGIARVDAGEAEVRRSRWRRRGRRFRLRLNYRFDGNRRR